MVGGVCGRQNRTQAQGNTIVLLATKGIDVFERDALGLRRHAVASTMNQVVQVMEKAHRLCRVKIMDWICTKQSPGIES